MAPLVNLNELDGIVIDLQSQTYESYVRSLM